MAADPGALLKRYDRLATVRGNFDTLWQELAEFIFPRKSVITVKRAPGEQLESPRLFDSTALHANTLLAATMHGALTSSQFQWFSLKMRRAELNEVKEVADWLQECEQRMYLAMRQSNFASEIHEHYLDLGCFGTAVTLVEGRPPVGASLFGGLLFRTLALGEYVIDEAPDGYVDTLFRQYEMTAKAAFQQWPKDLHEDIVRQAKDKPEAPVVIVHAIYPRVGRDETKRTRQEMPWASCYIDRKRSRIIEEGGFEEFPALAVRWAKTSGEMYGRGPGMTALPDVRTLNALLEMVLEEGAKAVAPPMKQLNDGVIGEVDLRPAGLTTVESMDALQPFESKARFDVGSMLDGRLETKIQRVFYWDQLQLDTSRAPTATEIEKRWELMRRILGPTLGRLEVEMLNPLINRVFGIMFRAGAFSPPPPDLGDEDIDVEYEGPLARSQRTLRVTGFEQTMQALAPLASVKPELFDNFDVDAITRDLGEISGLPSSYFLAKQQVAATRKARAEAQAQQQALMAAEQLGKAVGGGQGVQALQGVAQGGNGQGGP